MEKVIKSILYPLHLPGNVSFDIKKKYLEESGFEVDSFKSAVWHIRDYKIINLNFFETIHSKNTIVCYIKFLAKNVIIRWLKWNKIKIVYTVHNKQGHDTKFSWMDKSLMRLLSLNADRIVILCDETREYMKQLFAEDEYNEITDKFIRIPLVNYIDSYHDNGTDYRKLWNVSNEEMVLLFVGAVRPYKNIELILKAAEYYKDKKIKFVIAGSGNKDYVEHLTKMLSEQNFTNVIFEPKFVENSEMAAYARSCDIFVLPYNKKSALNSGTCLYAFSFERNVICPLIGTIKDIKPELVYSYDYNTEIEHEKELIKAIGCAYDDFCNNKKEFVRRQKELYKLAITEHSVETISEAYKKMYSELS